LRDKISQRLEFFDTLKIKSSLSKDGLNLNIWCPFCKHASRNKLKLSIHLEKCFYHCWICDKKGSDVSYLVSKINKNKVAEAKKTFKTRTKDNSLFSVLNEEEYSTDLNLKVDLPPDFKFIVEEFDMSNPDSRDVINYAIKRGFTKRKLYLLRAGYSTNYEYKRYLILPSYDCNGELNFYTARNIDQDTHNSYKYKNANIPKKEIIFNEINICWDEKITLVEGPLDLIKTNDNATCLLGSSLTEDMKLFQKIVSNKTPVVLALDADVYNKTLKIANLLQKYDIDVDILDTRGYEDVGEMSIQQFNDVYENAKKFNFNDNLLSKIRQL